MIIVHILPCNSVHWTVWLRPYLYVVTYTVLIPIPTGADNEDSS